MFGGLVPFCFSIIFVSLFLTKLVHLYIHAGAVSPLALGLYLPSLLLPDVFVICVSRLVLRRGRGLIAISICVLGCIFSSILLGGASSQLGFFYQTGNELEWEDAIGFAKDEEGMKVLLSGSWNVIASGLMIATIAFYVKIWLYRVVGAFLVGIGAPLVYIWRTIIYFRVREGRQQRYHYAKFADTSPDPYCNSDSEFYSDDEDDTEQAMALVYGEGWRESSSSTAQCFRETSSWAAFTGALIFLSMTTIFRPESPYGFMSTTLPVAMMEMFKSAPDACAEQVRLNGNVFPFPNLIDGSKWEMSSEYSKGWAPGTNNKLARKYRKHVPEWLPHPPPLGFSKWYPENRNKKPSTSSSPGGNSSVQNHHHQSQHCPGLEAGDTFYNPVSDPIKITNLDADIINVVQHALGNGSVKIKHVALIMMESLREDLFPLQMGSDIHKSIMASHKKGNKNEINARLSNLTQNSEKITGKPGNWKKSDGSDFDLPTPEWNDTTLPGFGGINVVGGFAASSVSTKSLAAIHCGAWPMAVDKFEEAETQPYQPCIPQIFELFNRMKEGQNKTDNYLEQEWYPAFFQSVTDRYDRQRKFNQKIGFQHVVTKTKIKIEADEELEEVNYFGYAETALKPHIESYIKSAQKNGRRMFLSHFTSTTHHPWDVPPGFGTSEYLNTKGRMSWHSDFDSYLNTIRWHDSWLGGLMQTFENLGIANETLVIFVGDHGQAFKEDDSRTGTYENGHISNFRVPIVFRHPQIPRVQYNANATSLSILPTILDLLINTGSLNDKDRAAASDLIQDYEGQSLIRPYKASYHDRRAWNFGIINAGGRTLSVTSADAPWRLVMPLDRKSEYRFTDLKNDPLELEPLMKWSVPSLIDAVDEEYGVEASKWVVEAEAVARWWGLERKRLWGYRPGRVQSEDAWDDDEPWDGEKSWGDGNGEIGDDQDEHYESGLGERPENEQDEQSSGDQNQEPGDGQGEHFEGDQSEKPGYNQVEQSEGDQSEKSGNNHGEQPEDDQAKKSGDDQGEHSEGDHPENPGNDHSEVPEDDQAEKPSSDHIEESEGKQVEEPGNYQGEHS